MDIIIRSELEIIRRKMFKGGNDKYCPQKFLNVRIKN
jgi:hypothetical protein